MLGSFWILWVLGSRGLLTLLHATVALRGEEVTRHPSTLTCYSVSVGCSRLTACNITVLNLLLNTVEKCRRELPKPFTKLYYNTNAVLVVPASLQLA